MTTLAAVCASKILNGAVSQADRAAAAPAPQTAPVDGRTFAQLMAFAVRYGALIRFYDLSDQPAGDWSAFFSSDPAVAEALHAALDLREIEQTLRSLLADAREAEDRRRQARLLQQAIDVIALLLRILDRSPPGGEGHTGFAALFMRPDRSDGLAEPLNRLREHDRHRTEHRERSDRAWREILVELLGDVAAALLTELARGLDGARASLEESLSQPGHAPQAAVWHAFVRMYEEARGELNRFPSRLLVYYYAEVLKQDSRPAEPSRVYLTFGLAPGFTQAAVAKGALFSAGADAQGQPINFAATSSLEVNAATVAGLKVQRVARGSGQDDGAAAPTSVLTGTVGLSPTDGSIPAPFPVFGADVPGGVGALTMAQASLGFAVATPTLLLAGGHRTVTISVTPTLSQAGADALAKAPAVAGTADVPTALAQLLAPAFVLNYSTAGGWMTVSNVTVTPAVTPVGGRFCVNFSFELPPDAPPLAPVSTKPAQDAPPPSLPASAFPQAGAKPTVIAQLQWDVLAAASAEAPGPVSPYEILSQVEIADIAVSVSVEGLPPLALSNSGGPVDASQDFPVFGLTPAQYSTLDISSPELFAKPLDSLSMSIAWSGLPVTTTGFAGYYQSYVLDADGVLQSSLFDNTTFRAALSVVSPGLWTLNAKAEFYLFQTAGTSTAPDGPGPAPDAPVQGTSQLAATQVAPQDPPPYYNPASSRLRLTLSEPKYAFGNILYASNLSYASAIAIAKLRNGNGGGGASGNGGNGSGAANGAGAHAQIAHAAAVNATAPDGEHRRNVSAAVSQAVTALNGQALASLHQAVASSQATPAMKSSWRQGLKAIGADHDEASANSLEARLRAAFGGSTPASVAAKLGAWISAQEANLLKWGGQAVSLAADIVAAAEGLMGALQATAGQSAPLARPILAAALKQAVGLVAPSPSETPPAAVVVNPPWRPMASAVTLNYTASTHLTPTGGPAPRVKPGPLQAMSLQAPMPSASPPPADADAFLHLCPFDQVADAAPAPAAQSGAPAAASSGPHLQAMLAAPTAPKPAPAPAFLLPQVTGSAALYIELSAPTDQVSLLFNIAAGPDGWSTGASDVYWEKQVGGAWLPVAAELGDTTNGLRNTGLVTLQLSQEIDEDGLSPSDRAAAERDAEPVTNIRAVLRKGGSHSAYLVSVTANALDATWVGPGGAAELAIPTPAGAITQSVKPIPGVGAIAQPMASDGGCPPATGGAFQLWMAERLRHKGFGVDAWDYARLVLAAFPTLWQVAVAPATEERTGLEAPGHVWLAVVAGRKTPDIIDPTVPMADPAMLTDVGEMVQALVSPFVKITVTNPPYVRLTVHATLIFSDGDTPAFWIARLQDELIRFLSPWPDDELGPRPADYYTSHAVAEFVRNRSYVRGVTRFALKDDGKPGPGGWRYFTSAASHALFADLGTDAAARRAVDRHRRRLSVEAPS